MSSAENHVVVAPGATAQTSRVYHRDFPEIRADGNDPKVAAEYLANQLTRALDSALTDWRRESLNTAIADVQAFVGEAGG